MVEPKSRNYRAWLERDNWGNGNRPAPEYTPQGLNNAAGTMMWSQCGIPQQGGNINYDRPLTANGQPLSWQSQATYQRGAIITVKLALTVNHSPGYFEFYACPRNQPLTEACFKQNPLTFRGDRLYGNQRAIATSQAPSVWPFDGFYHNYHNYEYLMQLPSGLTGDVLIQWVWINTASGWGEKFWNCAEVTISGGNGNTGGGTKLGDWALCSSSSQCSNGCCSGKYSGGDLKCTPLGQNFDFWANGCVSRRRLRGNETLVDN